MSKEHGSTAADVVRQAELLVMDYLRGTKCKRALDKMTSKISGSPSVIASELYALDLEKKRASNSNATVLNYMVSSASKNAPTSGSSSSRKSSSYTSESNESRTTSSFSADVDWTKEEISLLKKAIKNTSHITDKTERWKQIAAEVGNGKNKKHCYLKYKELREEKKNASPKSSTRRSSHISEDSADERTSSTSSRADSDTESGSISKETLKASKVLERKAVVEKEELLGFTRMTSSVGSNKILAPSKSSKQEIQVEDCEDFDSVVPSKRSSTSSTTASSTMSSYTSSNTHSSSSTYNFKIESRPPSVEEIEAMRKILLPDEKKSFSSHWEQQGFFFSDIDGLKYGLVQHEGGPCGVLAVVQAYVLRYLLAHEEEDEETWRNPDTVKRERALISALCHIVWQVSNKRKATLVLNDRNAPKSKRKFMESTVLYTASSQDDLRKLLLTHSMQLLEPKGNGLVLFVLSVVFTRGIDRIQSERDSVTGSIEKLIGGHDYCTQDLVNLLLCGQACSNVFDGNQVLDGKSESDPSAVILKGIPSRCDVGFLSLFEAYDYMVVGSNLKTPFHNIWVICSESHYSVLFCDPKLLQLQSFDKLKKFDLFYYDGLANQDEVIRLTINPNALSQYTKPNHEDLTPPINLVIQTKWQLASIDWNKTEPLL